MGDVYGLLTCGQSLSPAAEGHLDGAADALVALVGPAGQADVGKGIDDAVAAGRFDVVDGAGQSGRDPQLIGAELGGTTPLASEEASYTFRSRAFHRDPELGSAVASVAGVLGARSVRCLIRRLMLCAVASVSAAARLARYSAAAELRMFTGPPPAQGWKSSPQHGGAVPAV